MKKFLFLFILGFLALASHAFSQDTFSYSYDDSGNRILREVILLKSSSVAAESEEIETSLDDFKITIYPNPTKGNLKIDISGIENEVAIAYIYNMQGTQIACKTFSGTKCTINLSNQTAGMYLMKIIIGEHSSKWKIIKE